MKENIKIEDKINIILEELLKEIKKDKIQIFDCRDMAGDYKICLLSDENNIEVLYAPYYEYVEILGLPKDKYNKIYKKFGY